MVIAFYLAIIAHLLGDFYLQSNRLIQAKQEGIKGFLYHGLIHLVLLLPILIYDAHNGILIYIMIIAISHPIVDLIKSSLKIDNIYGFLLDQVIHFMIIYFAKFVIQTYPPTNHQIYPILLSLIALLIMLRPIDILIEKIFLNIDQDNNSSVSRWIGYIERILFMALILLNLQGFVAVFIGVKTASRWSAVQENKIFGLKYYIGTFVSVFAGIATGIFIKSHLKL